MHSDVFTTEADTVMKWSLLPDATDRLIAHFNDSNPELLQEQTLPLCRLTAKIFIPFHSSMLQLRLRSGAAGV